MARQFATRYTDEQGVEHTSHLVPRWKAISFALILREHLDRNASAVSRQPGGAWEYEWPKPENCLPVEAPAND